MFVPSLEAAKIAIRLLEEYEDDDRIEDALRLDHDPKTPEDFLEEHFAQKTYTEEVQDDVAELFFKILKYKKFLTMVDAEFSIKKTSWSEEKYKECPLNLEFQTLSESKMSPRRFLIVVPSPNDNDLPRSETLFRVCHENVLIYLLVIELNELSKKKIEELVMAISDKKALSLLAFLKRPDTATKLYEMGARIWDVEYVKDTLRYFLENSDLEEVYERVTSFEESAKINRKKELTIPMGPKCLNYQKKLLPPTEESNSSISLPRMVTRIPIMIRATEVPNSTYVKPIQLEKIEDACRKHREEARKKYEEAQRNAFRCANTEKSEKFRQLAEQIEKERIVNPIRKLSSIKVKAKNVKCPKKTAAVILREGARLLKLEQEEIKRYEHLASGGFNSDLIAEWEKEIREETFRKHIEDIEKKHLEGLISYEEALIAKQKCLKKKKEKAAEFRKEKENWMNQLEMWRREEQIRIQESFERGKCYERGAKEAVEHVKEEKHKIALETMEESRALKERWLKEKEQDLQRKVQLIKEIKALQALGVVRKKNADFTETANMGFLYEMSLAELKERLFILKIEIQEELERRRADIKMKRECRKEIIDSYQELIESHQKIVKEQKQTPQSKTEDEETNKKKTFMRSSSSLECLRRKLYEKRRERAKQEILC